MVCVTHAALSHAYINTEEASKLYSYPLNNSFLLKNL